MEQLKNIDFDKRVKVYKNSHKSSKENTVYSIMQQGKIVSYISYLFMVDCKFIVQPAGRLRVLKEGVKNVHAYISGYVIDKFNYSEHGVCVGYNPYKNDSFIRLDNKLKVEYARNVYIKQKEIKAYELLSDKTS